MRVSEIRVNQIRVNQGLGVFLIFPSWTMKFQKIQKIWDMEIIGNRRKIFFTLACISSGKFHGIICPQTPTGS